jgi:hypothetical protein
MSGPAAVYADNNLARRDPPTRKLIEYPLLTTTRIRVLSQSTTRVDLVCGCNNRAGVLKPGY